MAVDVKSGQVSRTVPKTTSNLAKDAIERTREVVNAILPPSQRRKWIDSIKQFATMHPKLAAFLLANIILSGGPLLLFATFVTTVLLVSLISAVIGALIATTIFTASMVLLALCVLVPTLFVTTMVATFTFGWALVGYWVLRWLTKADHPADIGKSAGMKLNSMSGGRLNSVGAASHERTAEVEAATQVEAQAAEMKDYVNGSDASTALLSGGSLSKEQANGSNASKTSLSEPREEMPTNLASPQPIRLIA